MRFLVTYQTVESMRQGYHPTAAAKIALQRILPYEPKAQVGVIAIDRHGNNGAACIGMDNFPYTTPIANTSDVKISYIRCLTPKST